MTQTEPATANPIDFSALVGVCLGRPEFAAKLLRIFLQQAPGWRDGVRGAVDGQDAEGIREICHAIRGGAGAILAEEIVATAERLVDCGRTPGLPGLEEARQALIQSIEAAEASVQAYLGDEPLARPSAG